ncbi:MAG: hypothetical protein NC548_47910 [Lachnospiraceae bacterium]|nr:hypothetical protein [Lachnospiraceae bacterium]
MTYQKFIKILALIAVVAFVFVCALVYLHPVKLNTTFGEPTITSKTYSNFETVWTGNDSKVTSESKTEYYNHNGSVKYILNTKTDFYSTMVNVNTLHSNCKCTAEYNNRTEKQDFQTNTTFTNSIITKDAIEKSVEESSKKCVDDCIKYGAEQFWGIK